MKFQYVCKDVPLTDAMQQACETKLSRFDRYFHSSDEVNCVVTVTIYHQQQKAIEVAISSLSGFTLRAKVMDEDFYAALDEVIDKLEGQMRKVKTQLKRAKDPRKSVFDALQMDSIEDDDDLDLDIVRKKKLSLAPMDAEEALARMDALGHSFFIYLDSTTGLVNVLYEREDHGYGVIEVEK